MTRREELYPVIARLRDQEGLMWREIGARLGLSRSIVQEYYADPTGEKVRARKDRYRGSCVDCGAPTDGSAGPGKAPRRCIQCAAIVAGAERKIWDRDTIIAAIQWWAEEHGEPPGSADFNETQARTALHDEARARRTERYKAKGAIPCHTTVYREFGSWNAALEAAGFRPRQPDGGGGNGQRQRSVATGRAKREHAARLYMEGLTYAEIAERVGYTYPQEVGYALKRLRDEGHDLPYRNRRAVAA